MGNGSRFWDRLANRYARQSIADEETYRKKLEITHDLLSPDAEILEIGCGTGSTALLLAPAAGRILATDYSARMIDIARSKAAEQKIGNVTFEQADIETLDFSGNRFDAVLGHNILHLLSDRKPAIAKVFDLLKPGGVFVSSTACLGGSMWALRVLLPAGRAVGLLPVVRFFSEEELAESLTAAGFVIDRRWTPGPRKAVFIVARKPAPA